MEIGSGAGFIKDMAPDITTSDILPYKVVDLVIDAAEMPFANHSISTVFLLNTLHHIPQASMFFDELTRCLMPGGRVLIIDQYHGIISRFIYKYLHHEPYMPNAEEWNFKSTGPLSGANGALCWIIFYRDKAKFEKLYPALKIVKRSPHTPLRYWLTGGLKSWNMLPGSLFGIATRLDLWLASRLPVSGSFVDIELVKN
ncbi:methyltransferase domain-containing protein [Thermodesulfobacteriota bacterium]